MFIFQRFFFRVIVLFYLRLFLWLQLNWKYYCGIYTFFLSWYDSSQFYQMQQILKATTFLWIYNINRNVIIGQRDV